MPLLQPTVVPAAGGCTGVVGGGFGFELLMQPTKKPAAHIAANNILMHPLLCDHRYILRLIVLSVAIGLDR